MAAEPTEGRYKSTRHVTNKATRFVPSAISNLPYAGCSYSCPGSCALRGVPCVHRFDLADWVAGCCDWLAPHEVFFAVSSLSASCGDQPPHRIACRQIPFKCPDVSDLRYRVRSDHRVSVLVLREARLIREEAHADRSSRTVQLGGVDDH